MSHSPLLHHVQPSPEVKAEVDAGFEATRTFVKEFDPDLIINFAPDHYNGFFYNLMPPFCIGYEAVAIGDYDSQAGPLDVPYDLVVRRRFNLVEGFAASGDLLDDVLRGGFPDERFGVAVPVFGPDRDRLGEVVNRGEHPAAQAFVGQFLEPPLHQIEPGT